MKKLYRFNKNKKFVLFDYETCGLNLASLDNKPWQLAFLVADQNQIFEKKDFYIKWEKLNISDEAKKITGFKEDKYLSKAVDPSVVLNEVEKFFYDSEFDVVGHNILGFDIYIHNIHRILCNKKPDYSYLDRSIDTNSLAKAKSMGIDLNGENFFFWQSKLQKIRKKGLKTSLKYLCKHYQVDSDESKLHDALYDITKNYEVFKKLIWDFEF